ncbi:hypothetical protein NG798_13190 [Ancylothrix sp. C2]|uniref:hypothetical protein n=1 Tax=Ancylothrix sp. D3o TaxID=2953691 RepID=UPI0021BA6792|nr:hypothetical protein [Ancylothrix sp. D3o]MCT7950750.1 hypothetical protein [Ancylothrix sp. D3o]
MNADERRWFLRGGLCFLGVLGFWLGVPVGAVMAQERGEVRRVCGGDFEGLVGLLVRDLPGYANREFRRSKVAGDRSRPSYVVIAGRPEFEPLPLGVGRSEGAVSGDGVRQVFVTTLERVYVGGEVVQLQGYHWLFLTETAGGWRLVMMFSRFGGYPTRGAVSPPQDTSNGAIAGAVRAWLRDCRAGSVRG